jgi:glycosyltransferase involved in cell wall biosynthesis
VTAASRTAGPARHSGAPAEGSLSVGLNLTFLTERSGGSGRYARELIAAVSRVEPDTRLTGFVSAEAPPEVLEADSARGVDWVRCPLKPSAGPPGNFAALMAWQWAVVPAIAARRGLDVVHGLANVAPLVSPRVARVVTLLDLIWIHHPEDMPAEATAGMRRTAIPSARAADRVIAISEAARDDLVATLGLPATKIDVTPLGINLAETAPPTPARELRGALGIGTGPLLLCVAQKRKHKNLAALVRALPRLGDDVQLVVPGSPTPYEQELRALAGEFGVAHRVHLPDWVSERDLEGLYALAACFVLPSLEEGFGLPVLEAMRRGVPVACSDRSALPEVAGEAALFFDPLDLESVVATLSRILGEPQLAADLVERGHSRCRQMTWERTARATLASYRRALTARRRR